MKQDFEKINETINYGCMAVFIFIAVVWIGIYSLT